MSDFLAFGNLTLDDVVTAAGQAAIEQLGGSSVYAAAGVRLWGESISLISVVGSDFPEESLAKLVEGGIDISGVERIDIPHGLRSRAFYFPDGSRTDNPDEAPNPLPPDIQHLLGSKKRYTDYGSPKHRDIWPRFSPSAAHIQPQHIDARYAHLAPGPIRNNRMTAKSLKTQTGGRITLTLDWPWWDYDNPARIDTALLQAIDYLLPSQENLLKPSGVHEDEVIVVAIEGLLAYGLKAVIVKRGVQGAYAQAQGWHTGKHIPIVPTEPVDPTGAGDSFCGGFMVGMARTGDIIQAAGYGAVSASFMLEDFGVLHSLNVTVDQAEARLESYRAEEASKDLTSSEVRN